MFSKEPNRIYPTETESLMMIRFQDCDPLQHLNNSKYFDYFFNAREDQLAKLYNFNLGQLYREFNSAWVAYQHQIAYIKPAYFSEWVRIISRVIFYDSNTIVVEYYMTDDQKKHLKTVFWSTLKYVNARTGRKEEHHPAVKDFLESILHPNIKFDGLQFNDRIKEIKLEALSNPGT